MGLTEGPNSLPFNLLIANTFLYLQWLNITLGKKESEKKEGREGGNGSGNVQGPAWRLFPDMYMKFRYLCGVYRCFHLFQHLGLTVPRHAWFSERNQKRQPSTVDYSLLFQESRTSLGTWDV